MKLQVFDVEHGQCALITCDNGYRILVDCGHSRNLGWSPGIYLESIGVNLLEMLAVTNYDEDHVSGLADLLDKVYVKSLFRNKSVSADVIKYLKTEDGYGPGIEALIEMIRRYNGQWSQSNPEPIYPNVKRQSFHCNFPEFSDENNLSLAIHFVLDGVGVMFTGDLECAGWRKLLEQEAFRTALSQTDIFFASHHGRLSGCEEEVFRWANPTFTVISDCGYQFDTQQTVPWYRARTRGGTFRGVTRHVLTTRNDGSLTFDIAGGAFYAN